MINTKQKLISAMNSLFWFGPKISTYYDSLSEPQFRSLLGGFSDLSLIAHINPFAYRETVCKLNNEISVSSSLENITSQSRTNDIDLNYIFENVNRKKFIDEIFHVNLEISGTSIHTYDLSDLNDSFAGISYKNKFSTINQIIIYNAGEGNLPVSFSAANGFGQFLGNPQNSFNIEPGCIFEASTINEPWGVTPTNRIITIGDGSSIDTRYEFVVFGKGDFE